MCCRIQINYINRNSMGNTLQEQQKQTLKKAFTSQNAAFCQNSRESSVRCSFGDNLTSQATAIQSGRFAEKERTQKSLDAKGRQKLSLSKEHNSQSQARLNLKRSASNDCKGITLSHNANVTQNYHSQITYKPAPPKIVFAQSNSRIKKVSIRPRDLPKRVSTEKVLIFPHPEVRRVSVQPRIIINPPMSSPCIQINYAKKPQSAKSGHSLQSSIVTPFVPSTFLNECTQKHHNAQQPKKLKKVALNRSYANSSSIVEEYNNGEEAELNKENRKGKCQIIHHSLPIESKSQENTEDQYLFTDPQLYSYITNKPHPCSNEFKAKYAMPVTNQEKPAKKGINSMLKQETSPVKMHHNFILRLQEAIPNEVESKAMIESGCYRFPTLTEMSEGNQTDNTSFIPISRNNSSRKAGMTGEEFLKFCRPKIDERVMADLQKLPIKS